MPKILHQPTKKITKGGQKMSDNNITELYGALSKFLSAISPAIDYVRELDASLTDLKQATGASDEELKQLFIDSKNIAKGLNTTTKKK